MGSYWGNGEMMLPNSSFALNAMVREDPKLALRIILCTALHSSGIQRSGHGETRRWKLLNVSRDAAEATK